jgi:purine-binding chemotaxis protein CheW
VPEHATAELENSIARRPAPGAPLPVRRKYNQPELRVVVFRLAAQEYVIDVAQVQEIIRPTDVRPLASAPAYVEGVVKRRGRIVPIVDLRKRLDLPVSPPTAETCVLIARLPLGPVGFVVDAASELMWVKTQDFEVPSPIIAAAGQIYLQGIAHLGARLLVMIDLEYLLTAAEQRQLEGMRESR